jgi:EAL domain-containing protein (putative c-di-GMP-specific phosphodiesterase class I)
MDHSLVALAHNFGMRVIAEGVETEDQMARITEIGCNEVQGYLVGKPTNDPRPYLDKAREEASCDLALVVSAAAGQE